VRRKQKRSELVTRPVVVNAPLDFTLKKLEVEHPYLKQRGNHVRDHLALRIRILLARADARKNCHPAA